MSYSKLKETILTKKWKKKSNVYLVQSSILVFYSLFSFKVSFLKFEKNILLNIFKGFII